MTFARGPILSALAFMSIAFLPVAHAAHEPGSEEDYSAHGPKIRRTVGEQGVEPGSELRETEKGYRDRRHQESEKASGQMPGTIGVGSPRPSFDDPQEEPAKTKERANRTANRIIPEVDSELDKDY